MSCVARRNRARFRQYVDAISCDGLLPPWNVMADATGLKIHQVKAYRDYFVARNDWPYSQDPANNNKEARRKFANVGEKRAAYREAEAVNIARPREILAPLLDRYEDLFERVTGIDYGDFPTRFAFEQARKVLINEWARFPDVLHLDTDHKTKRARYRYRLRKYFREYDIERARIEEPKRHVATGRVAS